MTRLHHDHTGGLERFSHIEILTSGECLSAARRQRGMIGAVPKPWPRWFDPTSFSLDTGLSVRSRSATLTRDGSISIV